MFQIFSRVGKVMKIVTFTKNNSFQALIQYPDVVTAQAAKLVSLQITPAMSQVSSDISPLSGVIFRFSLTFNVICPEAN